MQVLFRREAAARVSVNFRWTHVAKRRRDVPVRRVAELRKTGGDKDKDEDRNARAPEEPKLLITTRFTKLIDGKVNRDIWVEKSANWFNDKTPSAVDPEEELIAATKRFRDLKLIHFQYSNMIADAADKNLGVFSANFQDTKLRN